jgi:hypothetical protein
MKKAAIVVGVLVVIALLYWGSTSTAKVQGTIKNVQITKLSGTTQTVVQLQAAGAEAKNITFCGAVANRMPNEGTVVELGYTPKKDAAGNECNNLDRVRIVQ